MACLDTTVLLDLVGRSGRRRRADAEAKLRQLEQDRPHAITRFTYAEVLVGYELANDPARERAVLQPVLSELKVLEFNERSMRLYPNIYVHLRAIGRLTGTMDLLNASVALAHGARFVTRNVEHYVNVPGLRVDAY